MLPAASQHPFADPNGFVPHHDLGLHGQNSFESQQLPPDNHDLINLEINVSDNQPQPNVEDEQHNHQ